MRARARTSGGLPSGGPGARAFATCGPRTASLRRHRWTHPATRCSTSPSRSRRSGKPSTATTSSSAGSGAT
eukprot:11991799-Alexandrium_andersonii.AAC.1